MTDADNNASIATVRTMHRIAYDALMPQYIRQLSDKLNAREKPRAGVDELGERDVINFDLLTLRPLHGV